MTNYLQKYNKYKSKYIALKKNIYGGTIELNDLNKEYLHNIMVKDNIIGYGAYGTIYKDDVKKLALKEYIKKQSVTQIRHDSQIINTMSDNNIGPKYYGTILFTVKNEKIDEIERLNPTDVLKEVPEFTQEYNYIVITDLYDSDLKQFLIDTSMLSYNLENILTQISTLILRSLEFYVCSDIKFENMLIKQDDSHYTVVLTDFDGGFCETKSDTNDKEMTHKLILLLLLMSSLVILKNNINKHKYDYIYKLDINKIKLFYYDELKTFFNKNKEQFIEFLKSSLYTDAIYNNHNKFNNIIFEILKLIYSLGIKEEVKIVGYTEFNQMAIMGGLIMNRINSIDVVRNLIDLLFKKDLQGGNISEIDKTENYDKYVPISEGSYSKIYDINGKIHKVNKKPIKSSNLARELSIYDEYNKRQIGVPVENYFFEGKYGYIMEKYNCDLEEFFINYFVDDKLSSYEEQIKSLIDKMFETPYICGDIKFKNMLIKDGTILLTDFDYKFCFDKEQYDYKIYKLFIYFSLLCSLYVINIKRLHKLLDLKTKLFKSDRVSNFKYVRLFDDQKDLIKEMILTEQFLNIRRDQKMFFFSQFHYIYRLYSEFKKQDKDEIDDETIYKNMKDDEITAVFNFILKNILI
jgi:hypothetical protein